MLWRCCSDKMCVINITIIKQVLLKTKQIVYANNPSLISCFVCLVHLSIHLQIIHKSIHQLDLFTRLSNPLIRPSIHLVIHSSIYHQSIKPAYPFITSRHMSIHLIPFIHTSIHLSMSIYSYIYVVSSPSNLNTAFIPLSIHQARHQSI